MRESNPSKQRAFVHADGVLAEWMCHVHLIELTIARARELREIHCTHPPDDCTVHLEAAYLLFSEEEL